ncbi:MAG: type II toxin-antitoxin system HigB family toxin [Flavobacteriales bacterium]|nr:type II toxin-antitoxin system HigB family toxin [Flavobacteriales bacterium]
MKVSLVSQITVRNYCTHNTRARPRFHIFIERLKKCDWNNLNDIKADFPNMSIVENCDKNRIVFNVGGNNYRVICDYNFFFKCRLFIAFIGTHAEYDKIDACSVKCK